jgi:hypothetical protein
MKRLFLFAVLLLVAVPMFAIARTVVVVDDVIRMSKAGVGDDEIIAFVRKSAEPFDVTGDDVIAMTDAKVSRAVVKAVIDESSTRMRSERRDDGDRTRTRTVYVAPYYDPFSYSYDPFYYRPSLYLGFGFGRSYYYGGGYYRGGGHHFRRH